MAEVKHIKTVYALEFKDKGYFAANQLSNYRWSYTTDIRLAKLWVQSQSADDKGLQGLHLVTNPNIAYRVITLQQTIISVYDTKEQWINLKGKD